MLLIYVPTATEKEAKEIGKVLVQEKFAVCVNIIPNITSFFKWEGKLEEVSEALLLIKTNSPYEKVQKRIEELHSYETPLVSGMKLDHLNKKYKDWTEKED